MTGSGQPIAIGKPLSLDDLCSVAAGRPVELCPDAEERVRASRRAIDAIVEGGDQAPAVYGINTGFGALAEQRISSRDVTLLQRNLVRSHACGVGPELDEAQVRAMIALRAQVVAQGYSGVRLEVVRLLLEMLNRGVHPVIFAQGSVGASGDLAPLAHLALVLIGEGEARYEGRRMPGADALRHAGLEPVTLAAKEGLALINGTQFMTGIGALALDRARKLCVIADVVGATSLEALQGSKVPFDPRLMAVRPHPGQADVAANLRALLADSAIMESHVGCAKVQDPYSLRCMPQVHGATRDAIDGAVAVLERELNAVTDNPTVFLSDDGADILSGGNFHGQPVSLALDFAAIAVAELANISERRVEQLVNPALSSGLTPFLTGVSGLESGFMIAQVASASLVSENKIHAHPATVDSIPSSANREDHVSMGSIAAQKLVRVVDNVETCLAIELLAAAQGIDQRAPLTPGRGVAAAHAALRQVVPTVTEDRPLYRDFDQTRTLLEDGTLRHAVELVLGPLA